MPTRRYGRTLDNHADKHDAFTIQEVGRDNESGGEGKYGDERKIEGVVPGQLARGWRQGGQMKEVNTEERKIERNIAL